ncbi:MAG: L-rhamnose mutarotase [Bacteroidales bacterium]|nr:L-rhamnose mutarotase [Bacteroidales bacterium]
MMLEYPKEKKFEDCINSYDTSHPRVAEWHQLMSTFQVAPPKAPEGQTWVNMDKVYDFQVK